MRHGARRISWWWILAFAALSLLPQLAPQNFPADDALFYTQVARNIAAGQGSTFNTITPTNGYHPLWMAACVAAAALARGDQLLLLRLVFAVQALLTLFLLFRFRRLVSGAAGSAWIVAVAVVAPYFVTGMYGSEAHLNGVMLVLSCGAMVHAAERSDARSFAILGALLGLAVLARLDNVFVAGSLLATAGLSARTSNRRRLELLAAGGAALSAVVLPYLAYNAWAFGGPIPVSGVIKSTFPRVTGRISNLGSLGTIVALGGLASLAIALSPGIGSRASRASRQEPTTPELGATGRMRLLLLGLGAGTLLHALYVVLFTNHRTIWSWYYVSGVLNLGILASFAWTLLAARLTPRTSSILATAMAILCLGVAATRGVARVRNPQAVGNDQLRLNLSSGETRWTVTFAHWLDAHLPRGSGLMAYDYPGALAFYSSVRVLPQDGLIGDYAYNRDLVREGVAGYLRSRGVAYYLGPVEGEGEDSVEVFAPLGQRSAGYLRLHPANRVVRVRDLAHMSGAPDVAVWRLEP